MLYAAAMQVLLLLHARSSTPEVIDDRLKNLLEHTKNIHSIEDDADDAESAATVIEDNWYIVQMGGDGQVVGRMHTTVSSVAGMFESTESLEVVLQRGSDRSAMFIETEVVEDAKGAVRMQRLAHQMGATMTTSVRYVWNEDGKTVEVTSSSGRGSHAIVRTEPAPDAARVLGRYASEVLFKSRAAAGEKTIELVTLRPEFGLEEVRMTRSWQNATQVDMAACGSVGEHAAAMTWNTVIEGVPMNMTELYSASGATDGQTVTLVQSNMESPFGPLVCTLCRGESPETALAASTAAEVLASASPLPEIVYSVAVPLPGAIPGMGWPGTPRCVYKVRHLAGLSLSLPSTGYQRVRRKKKKPQYFEELNISDPEAVREADEFKRKRASEVRVIVDARATPKDATAAELADSAYSQATAMVDSDDDEIKALAATAT